MDDGGGNSTRRSSVRIRDRIAVLLAGKYIWAPVINTMAVAKSDPEGLNELGDHCAFARPIGAQDG
jgi:hypothetical protein